MRSIRWLAVITGAVMVGSACGGDNGGPGPDPNDPPVAGFSEVCTDLSCVFTDASTDPDGDATITAWSWNFGDGTPVSSSENPTHVFPAAGTYTVEVIVTDDEGATDPFSKQVTVTTTVPGNVNPTASFEATGACTAGTPCGFNSTSTDPDGTIVTAAWQFGDTQTGEGLNVTHTFDAAGTFNVMLTVTDDDGGTGTITQPIIVAPAASQDCTTTGTVVDCSLTMTQRVTVKFTVVSRACELTGNRLETTAPEPDQIVFFHLCNRAPGEEYTLRDAGGLPLVLEAGTNLAVHFVQGTADAGDPPSGEPGIEVDGAYPNWTLRIDDGGNAGIGGEPDFDDAVISVQATLAP